MSGFILSFRSEFFKSRKTLGFWAAILLPLLICLLLFIGFYTKSERLVNMPPMMLWLQFSGTILTIMGSLLLPMFVIFIGYSVNSIEHKADAWKSLFSLPVSKWAVYAAKYSYALFLVFLCMAFFVLFTIGFGNLLGLVKPTLRFDNYHIEGTLMQLYFKLFLSAVGTINTIFIEFIMGRFPETYGDRLCCNYNGCYCGIKRMGILLSFSVLTPNAGFKVNASWWARR